MQELKMKDDDTSQTRGTNEVVIVVVVVEY